MLVYNITTPNNVHIPIFNHTKALWIIWTDICFIYYLGFFSLSLVTCFEYIQHIDVLLFCHAKWRRKKIGIFRFHFAFASICFGLMCFRRFFASNSLKINIYFRSGFATHTLLVWMIQFPLRMEFTRKQPSTLCRWLRFNRWLRFESCRTTQRNNALSILFRSICIRCEQNASHHWPSTFCVGWKRNRCK